mmetsp:Transcript_25934/g.37181  ORF Transcript_25934/g.37181 Transcript_25934/m.37181 type:complete len:188 (+) Transcript_25934:96-659(+)
MKYRQAIIRAIEDLKDVSGSLSVAIRTYIQDVIFPENSKWINSLFLRTLKSMGKSGDLIEHNMRYKLSPDLEKKRAEAIEAHSNSKKKTDADDKRKRKKVIPAKKTTKAKLKLEPRRSKKKKIQKEGEKMEIRHEISKPSVGDDNKEKQKPAKVEQEEIKKKRSNSVVFSPKIKSEKSAMKVEKLSL